jgi:hypothetical protein
MLDYMEFHKEETGKNGYSLCLRYKLCFVTQDVEKSNFYKDLEEVLDWKESNKNLVGV